MPPAGVTVLHVVRLIVNGKEHAVDPSPGRTLLDVLREDLGLTGAKNACGEGECGACTVLVDGSPARSCVLDLDPLDGRSVGTVEGLAPAGRLHPVQAAFVAARSLQCGYCTPGMVMSAVALLAGDPHPDEPAIRTALAGNICRCGGYPRIVRAVRAAAETAPDGGPDSEYAVPAESGTEPGTTAPGWTVLLPPTGDDVRQHRDWGWTIPGGARLDIDGAGNITAYTGKVDAGQGNRVSLTRSIAAELGVSTGKVRLDMGDTATAPYDLGTFGSRSTPDIGHALRLLATVAREELIGQAARRWEVDPADLLIADGTVRVRGVDRAIGYGALVSDAPRTITVDADRPIPPGPPGIAEVDDAEQRRYLTAAVTGAKRFPSDLTLPGMLYARVLRPPAHGATPHTVDTAAARRLPDVTVIEDGDLVATLAPTRAAATAALRAVRADWRFAAQPSEAELETYLRTHPTDGVPGWGPTDRETGDVDTARADADLSLAATYRTAYIAHVPMEPRVALATVDAGGATVWVGTQRPFGVRDQVAEVLGLTPDRVRVIVPDFGGGFGGKHWPDVAVQAARLARAAGRPVKVCWTREEEFSWAYFRPAAVIDVRSSANRAGELTSWEFTNINSGAVGLFSPYRVANVRERYVPADSPLPQGSYRALAATANHFARESHLDELACVLGSDPIELRRRHSRDDRLVAVLDAAAEAFDWPNRPHGGGRGAGIACGVEKDARVATAAEVFVDADGVLRVSRVVTAVDCGAIVDPSGLRNQINGATIMGLGGALFEAIHFDAGRIRNASLAGYRVPRFTNVPPIEVILLDRQDIPSAGAGETPIITIAPAIANAVNAATGRRLRSLPLVPDGRVPR